MKCIHGTYINLIVINILVLVEFGGAAVPDDDDDVCNLCFCIDIIITVLSMPLRI